jgi:hypothetical protein
MHGFEYAEIFGFETDPDVFNDLYKTVQSWTFLTLKNHCEKLLNNSFIILAKPHICLNIVKESLSIIFIFQHM